MTNYLSAMEGCFFAALLTLLGFYFLTFLLSLFCPKLCVLPTLTKDKITKILQLS